MAERYVYRLVVDTPATVWPTSCWRCGTKVHLGETPADDTDSYCDMCYLDLSPARIGGSRRTFLSAAPVNKRAALIAAAGGRAHLERSEPIRWPA